MRIPLQAANAALRPGSRDNEEAAVIFFCGVGFADFKVAALRLLAPPIAGQLWRAPRSWPP
jgi:hypothetical protein